MNIYSGLDFAFIFSDAVTSDWSEDLPTELDANLLATTGENDFTFNGDSKERCYSVLLRTKKMSVVIDASPHPESLSAYLREPPPSSQVSPCNPPIYIRLVEYGIPALRLACRPECDLDLALDRKMALENLTTGKLLGVG